MPFLARLRRSNPRLPYFLGQYARLCVPRAVLERRREALLEEFAQLPAAVREAVTARAKHYLRVDEPFEVPAQFEPIRLWNIRSQRNYHFDLLEHLRWFPASNRVAYRFGDETAVPATPTIVKARPIEGDNRNSVLLKLNRVRHYRFVRDRRDFAAKRPTVVWRGRASRAHRRAFLERYFDHPLCDVGQAHSSDTFKEFAKPFLSLDEQLEHQFVLSIEGNDVATNLKWILSSNSLCVMTRPKFETWFMEGSLVPGEHYVQVADDYSDLEEKVRHYSSRPDEARRILENAHAYVAQFRDRRREKLLALLVLQRYFELSGQ